MTTFENITLSGFKSLLNLARLPTGTRLTVTFEDQSAAGKLKRKKATQAMQKLRGSGNGNLVNALLEEREKYKLL